MICNTCAKEVMNYSAFCYHCGAKIILVTPKAVVPNSQTRQLTAGKSSTVQYIAVQNFCPVCRKNDQIQRVNSIVDAGTHHTFGSSTATYTTDLSGRLDHFILPIYCLIIWEVVTCQV